MNQIKKDLGYLGEDYQFRLVHEFLSDNEFYSEWHDLIDPNEFTNPQLKDIVCLIKDWYSEYGLLIDYTNLRTKIRDRYSDDYTLDVTLETLDKIEGESTQGSEYNRKLAEDFFQQQAMVKCANELLKCAKNRDKSGYEKCSEEIRKVLQSGGKNEMGNLVYDKLEETLSDDYRIAIPTGIKRIDETLEGGLGKEELGVIIGPSSFGKTSLTTAIAAYAATHGNKNDRGFKVLQIVFEDRVKQIRRKHFGYITGIEAKDLSKPENIEKVKEQLAKYDKKELLAQNLRIMRLPSGEKSAEDIQTIIKKQINNGFRPDLVIIDYFECLKMVGDSSSTEWEKEGKAMRKFEAMAGEMNLAIWIPLQGTKESVNADIVTMEKAGGSFKKIQIAHIVMSIARTTDDISENKATIAILKNRAGKAGAIFNNVEFNNGTCRISTDNVVEFDSFSRYNDNNDQKKLTDNKMVLKRFEEAKKLQQQMSKNADAPF